MIGPLGLMELILMMHQNLSERKPLAPHHWDKSGAARIFRFPFYIPQIPQRVPFT